MYRYMHWSAFRSLRSNNYRLWAAGAAVSNIGTWMQRIAQDWLVLTQLTDHNATAVGIVTGLQFAPQILVLPWTGFTADRMDRRKLLLATQAAMGLLALGLGLLTLLGAVRLWEVYVFAFLLGLATAFDAPARHAFVSDLVSQDDLSNAVALNSASFNAARMVGPALAGLLMARLADHGLSPAAAVSWVFLINAASFVAVLVSLTLIRTAELQARSRVPAGRGSLADGFRYVWGRPELRVVFVMIFLIGAFGVHFPIYISAMAVKVFHQGAGQFGLATSVMAVGSLLGALVAGAQARPRIGSLVLSATVFGLGFLLTAAMPTFLLFSATLVIIGVAAQSFTTTSIATVQLATDPAMRGRVMALLFAVALGGAPIGAPVLGWVADHLGARWALGVGAASGLAAALLGLYASSRTRPHPSPVTES